MDISSSRPIHGSHELQHQPRRQHQPGRAPQLYPPPEKRPGADHQGVGHLGEEGPAGIRLPVQKRKPGVQRPE